jgi:hypothetical protein
MTDQNPATSGEFNVSEILTENQMSPREIQHQGNSLNFCVKNMTQEQV